MADFYEILEVPRDASGEDIKRAYRRLARKYHPDANPGDAGAEARFKELAAAYEVLSDPEKRSRYDRYGSVDGFDFADPFGAGGGLGDLFDAFFGSGSPFGGRGGRGPSGPPRGPDLDVSAVLELHDAVFGTRTEVTVRTAVVCEDCEATGAAPGTESSACADCGGAGEVRTVRNTVLGQIVSTSACRRCGGSGRVIPEPCPTCKGEGRVVTDRSYTVDVPPGVDDGSTLRLSGRGAVGARGGAPGDLYVRLRVKPHRDLARQGDDLVRHLRIAMTQAVLGTSIGLETLDGTEELTIPRGTEAGKVFRLKGRGVPHLNGRGRGDLVVVVDIDVPGKLDEQSEQLLRTLAEHRGEAVTPDEEGFFSRIRSAFS
jgi:molecular chaperone DnaJ